MQQKPEDIIRGRIVHELTETVPNHPGVMVPKKDRIQEWTLYQMLEQLQALTRAVNAIEVHLRLKG